MEKSNVYFISILVQVSQRTFMYDKCILYIDLAKNETLLDGGMLITDFLYSIN